MPKKPGRRIGFGKYDVTNMISGWGYEGGIIEDKETNINSVLSTRRIIHTGGSNGTFTIPERKEGKMLNVLVDKFDGGSVNEEQYQLPIVLTYYDEDTLAIDRTYVYPNSVVYKSSFSEPEEKKNGRHLTYTWNSEDTWTFIGGTYVYVDELTATEEKTYKLSKEVESGATSPILNVIVNNETLQSYQYTVEVDESGTGSSIVLKDTLEVEAGNKIVVVYKTNSTVML